MNLQPTEINNNKQTDFSLNEENSKKCVNEPEVGRAVKSTPKLEHKAKQEAHHKTRRFRRRSRKNISKVNILHFSNFLGLQFSQASLQLEMRSHFTSISCTWLQKPVFAWNFWNAPIAWTSSPLPWGVWKIRTLIFCVANFFSCFYSLHVWQTTKRETSCTCNLPEVNWVHICTLNNIVLFFR